MYNPTIRNRNTNIVQSKFNGQNVLKATNGAKASEEAAGILVKKDDAGQWAPVDKLESSIDRADMAENYGLWTDASQTDGGFLNTGLFAKTTREKDGKIQNDEVSDFKTKNFTSQRRYGQRLTQVLGSEIKKSDEGFGTLHTVTVDGYGYTNEEETQARMNDQDLWLVAK